MKTALTTIEEQLDQLSSDEQPQLVEELVRRLRTQDEKAWADDLAAMAADPEIRSHLRQTV